MYIDELKKMIRKTSSNSVMSTYDWDQIEEELKVDLPDDYKSFAEHFGVGKIEQYITVFHPLSKAPLSKMSTQKKMMSHTYNYAKEVQGLPYNYWDDNTKEGLFPFGMTTNGDCFFWHISDGNQTVVYYDHGLNNYTETDKTFSEFIYQLLKKEIPVTEIPEKVKEKDEFIFREDILWTYR